MKPHHGVMSRRPEERALALSLGKPRPRDVFLGLIEKVRAENTVKPYEYRFLCNAGTSITMVDQMASQEIIDCPMNRTLTGNERCHNCEGKIKGEMFLSDVERMRNAGVQLMADGLVAAMEETNE